MKRALMASTLMAGALLGTGGAMASEASASPLSSSAYVAGPVAGAHADVTTGVRPASLSAPAAKAHAAVYPERRRTTTRKKSGAGKVLGALAFIFIVIPILIIAAIVIFFVMRSNRKKREREMAQQMNNQQFNNGFNNQGPRY